LISFPGPAWLDPRKTFLWQIVKIRFWQEGGARRLPADPEELPHPRRQVQGGPDLRAKEQAAPDRAKAEADLQAKEQVLRDRAKAEADLRGKGQTSRDRAQAEPDLEAAAAILSASWFFS
jgi:hypothetical protein